MWEKFYKIKKSKVLKDFPFNGRINDNVVKLSCWNGGAN